MWGAVTDTVKESAQIVTDKANKAAQAAAKSATNLGDAIKIPQIPAGRNKQTPLATENLLAGTDGLSRAPF